MKIPSTIIELHEDLKNKKYTCVELVEHYLGKINSQNKALNAFLTITDNEAFKKAKELDRIILDNPKAFDEFPLLGVVMSLKDIYLTEGIRTTAASKVLENYMPQYSGTVVHRLESAGVIVIGKANCDAWAHGASGENSDFGPTKNPWNIEYVPGGSSSGSAVSVSAGMTFASMGTDTGGSIRLPASFTNLVGFKPTYGVVSRYGVISMASSLDSMGHFTKTVEDSERIFNVTRGVDGFDSTVVDHAYKAENINKKFKIGIPKEYFAKGLDPEIESKVMNAAKEFEKMGVELINISLPHTKYAISVYYIVQPAEVSSNLGRFDGIRYGNDRESFGSEAKRRIMLGTYVLSSGYYDAYYGKAMKVRSLVINDFDEAFSTVDAILAPVSPSLPFKIGQKVNDPLQMYLADIYTVAANLAGIPGLSLPGGFSESGLPIGFQLLGKRFSESTLFDLGKKYQAVTNWHDQNPL